MTVLTVSCNVRKGDNKQIKKYPNLMKERKFIIFVCSFSVTEIVFFSHSFGDIYSHGSSPLHRTSTLQETVGKLVSCAQPTN